MRILQQVQVEFLKHAIELQVYPKYSIRTKNSFIYPLTTPMGSSIATFLEIPALWATSTPLLTSL